MVAVAYSDKNVREHEQRIGHQHEGGGHSRQAEQVVEAGHGKQKHNADRRCGHDDLLGRFGLSGGPGGHAAFD